MFDARQSKKSAATKADVQAKAAKNATQKKEAGDGKSNKGGGPASRIPLVLASKGIASVREALIAYFRDVFVPSAAFKETFGGRSWDDVRDEVLADVERFGLDPDGDIYREPDGSATYTGRIWGLYTEVAVQPGEEPSVYVEIE